MKGGFQSLGEQAKSKSRATGQVTVYDGKQDELEAEDDLLFQDWHLGNGRGNE